MTPKSQCPTEEWRSTHPLADLSARTYVPTFLALGRATFCMEEPSTSYAVRDTWLASDPQDLELVPVKEAGVVLGEHS